jgi:hypothetical protein
MLDQPFNTNHGSAVLETQQISLEYTLRIIPILVRVISIEERVPETLLFGMPPLKVRLCTRLSFLPLAPCNAGCNGFTCIHHGSLHSWVVQVWTLFPIYYALLSNKAQDRYQGTTHRILSGHAPKSVRYSKYSS